MPGKRRDRGIPPANGAAGAGSQRSGRPYAPGELPGAEDGIRDAVAWWSGRPLPGDAANSAEGREKSRALASAVRRTPTVIWDKDRQLRSDNV
ncbi:hypothetical protein AB0A70_07995 [Streptomyces morookaense]|uniref:hypothetical protein n=1 Tax=Streptomyces morookaense TaxID=1970 RepID=UPI00340FF624